MNYKKVANLIYALLVLNTFKRMFVKLEAFPEGEQERIMATWLKEDCEAIAGSLSGCEITDYVLFADMIDLCDMALKCTLLFGRSLETASSYVMQIVAEMYGECLKNTGEVANGI
jgi:hypothetical protein